jgi:hypothetical protein
VINTLELTKNPDPSATELNPPPGTGLCRITENTAWRTSAATELNARCLLFSLREGMNILVIKLVFYVALGRTHFNHVKGVGYQAI